MPVTVPFRPSSGFFFFGSSARPVAARTSDNPITADRRIKRDMGTLRKQLVGSARAKSPKPGALAGRSADDSITVGRLSHQTATESHAQVAAGNPNGHRLPTSPTSVHLSRINPL